MYFHNTIKSIDLIYTHIHINNAQKNSSTTAEIGHTGGRKVAKGMCMLISNIYIFGAIYRNSKFEKI